MRRALPVALTSGIRVYSKFVAMGKVVKYLLAALLLWTVGCNSDEVAIVKRSVSLFANDADVMRSSFGYDAENNKYKTSWVEGDAMRVLLTSEGVEPKDYRFDLKDVASGRFECSEVEDVASQYDVYGVYPSSAEVSADCKAKVQVGAKVQRQIGLSPNHIAEFDPSWGSQKGVSLDAIDLRMHHTAAVMQFAVENKTGAEVAVESVKIYAPKVIAGEHTLDLQSGELAATQSVSDRIELEIVDVALADKKSAKAWVAMSPFVMAEGESLVFVVTTTDGKAYKYVKSFAAEVEFPSGKVMSMSAPIVLSEQTLMAESLAVAVDLTKSSSYLDNFPTAMTKFEAVQEYLLGGYPFKIYCTQPYACGNAKDKLRIYFNGESGSLKPTAEDYALIYLPYYEGYKVDEVKATLSSKETNKFRIAIANPDNLEAALGNSNSPSDTSFDISEMIDDMHVDISKQCCIYIHFNDSNNITKDNCNCYINNISINYILE